MRRLTTEEFIDRARACHTETYDYSLTVYHDMHTNVKIICPKHGMFLQTPSNHLKGAGCHVCHKYESRALTLDDFLNRAYDVHGTHYDYSRVKYVNNKTPVEIICPIHGPFWQKPEKHWIGQVCPKCTVNYKDNTDSFIQKSRKIHGDLYDYSHVQYVNQKEKVCIIDPEYGEFWQSPNAHLNGEGCPKRRCSKYQSKSQIKMIELLIDRFGVDDVEPEYFSDVYPYHVDAYIKSIDLYIELNAFWTHGGHWFDKSSSADNAVLDLWQSKDSSAYETAIYTWTVLDVEKRETALRNHLNYLVFWKNDLSDFYQWYNNIA